MRRLRVCLVYDCLYPWTIGGAERWYRTLAERLAAAGHDVTYVTLRQWRRGDDPGVPGIRVVAVGPRMALYAGHRRRIWPPMRFGAGVFAHFVCHGREYDVVHAASFPFFSLLAAGALRPWTGFALVVDWWEVWSDSYWRSYLGPVGGRIGSFVQRACARISHRAQTPTAAHARRLRGLGHRGVITVSTGVWSSGSGAEYEQDGDAGPTVVYLGRHTPDKRVDAIPHAIAVARNRRPDLRACIFGDGPSRPRVTAAARAAGVEDAIALPGFVSEPEVDAALRSAMCLVLPSRREGLGLAVLDAASRGVPSVVVRGPDNAATDLIVPGVNGAIAAGSAPSQIAAAILEVADGGDALRSSTRDWWRANASRFAAESGVTAVLAVYLAAIGEPGDRGSA